MPGWPSRACPNSASSPSSSGWSLRRLTPSVARAPALVGGREVGVDVGAAEGVDRLLGVADQDERRLAVAEGALDDLPLDRVGVLELVDQDDPVALPQLATASAPRGPLSVSSSRVS